MDSAKKEQDQSMEDILKTIRNVISGEAGEADQNAEDVLELTDMITEDGEVVSLKDEADENQRQDVLENIDSILNSEKAEEALEEALEEEEEEATAEEPVAEPVEEESNAASEIDEAPAQTEPEETPTDLPSDPALDTPEINETDVEIPAVAVINDQQPARETNMSADLPDESKKKRLISQENAEASTEPLKALMKSVSKSHGEGLTFRSGTTVEDLVIELLKPQLSEWLNQNLPSLVKHVVEKEIKKLIPRDDD